MLNKPRLLATILIFTLWIPCFVEASSIKSKTSVMALLEPGVYLTQERWRVKLAFVDIPSHSALGPAEFCYQAALESYLKDQILEKPVHIKWVDVKSQRQLYRQGQLKLHNGSDLALILLEKGWAKTQGVSVPSAYLERERLAQQQKLGLWGACDNWYALREKQRLNGNVKFYQPAQRNYLDAVSTGWVKAIKSPTEIELDDGQLVHLQGLKSTANPCLNEATVDFLQYWLVGKKVRLESDGMQFKTKGKRLVRYVWRVGNRFQNDQLVNRTLLGAGRAQIEFTELNLKYVDAMQHASVVADEALQNLDWWHECALQSVTSAVEVKTIKPLVFDQDCPIKGNISGSKKKPKLTYHTPASGWYKRLQPEACFVSEIEAEGAGFAKIK